MAEIIAAPGALLAAWPGLAVHARRGQRLWASRGYDILLSEDGGEHWQVEVRLPCPPGLGWCARITAARRLLRCGVRAWVQLTEQSFVAFAGGRMYFGEQGKSWPRLGAKLRHGRAPLGQGCCRDDAGTCFGEYWQNRKREPVGIHCWRPQWPAPRLFYEFSAGRVRHIHGLQFDPFSRRLWAATGDRDQECMIGYFQESGGTRRFVPITAASQDARAVSLVFTADAVYWGTDAGRDTRACCNFLCRWPRRGGPVERLMAVAGPVYYSGSNGDGKLVFSTAVEGSRSEADRLVRLWVGEADRCRQVAAWEKDRYPRIFGHAVARFPEEGLSADRVYVVTEGLAPHDGTWVLDARRLLQ